MADIEIFCMILLFFFTFIIFYSHEHFFIHRYFSFNLVLFYEFRSINFGKSRTKYKMKCQEEEEKKNLNHGKRVDGFVFLILWFDYTKKKKKCSNRSYLEIKLFSFSFFRYVFYGSMPCIEINQISRDITYVSNGNLAPCNSSLSTSHTRSFDFRL